MAYSLKQSIAVLMKVHFVFMNRIHFKRKKVDGPVIVTGGKK